MTPPLHLRRLIGLLLLSLAAWSVPHSQAKEKKPPPSQACEQGHEDKACARDAEDKTGSNTSAAYKAASDDKADKPAHKRKKKAKKKGAKKTKASQSDGF